MSSFSEDDDVDDAELTADVDDAEATEDEDEVDEAELELSDEEALLWANAVPARSRDAVAQEAMIFWRDFIEECWEKKYG